MPEHLPKPQVDALVIIRYNVDCAIPKRVIEQLELSRLIVKKHGGGWMLTSTGREFVKRIK